MEVLFAGAAAITGGPILSNIEADIEAQSDTDQACRSEVNSMSKSEASQVYQPMAQNRQFSSANNSMIADSNQKSINQQLNYEQHEENTDDKF